MFQGVLEGLVFQGVLVPDRNISQQEQCVHRYLTMNSPITRENDGIGELFVVRMIENVKINVISGMSHSASVTAEVRERHVDIWKML